MGTDREENVGTWGLVMIGLCLLFIWAVIITAVVFVLNHS